MRAVRSAGKVARAGRFRAGGAGDQRQHGAGAQEIPLERLRGRGGGTQLRQRPPEFGEAGASQTTAPRMLRADGLQLPGMLHTSRDAPRPAGTGLSLRAEPGAGPRQRPGSAGSPDPRARSPEHEPGA